MKNYYVEYPDGKRKHFQFLTRTYFSNAIRVLEVEDDKEPKWCMNKVDNINNKVTKEELIDIILKT